MCKCEEWLSKNYGAEYHLIDEFRGSPSRVNSGLSDRSLPLNIDGTPYHGDTPPPPPDKSDKSDKDKDKGDDKGKDDKGAAKPGQSKEGAALDKATTKKKK